MIPILEHHLVLNHDFFFSLKFVMQKDNLDVMYLPSCHLLVEVFVCGCVLLREVNGWVEFQTLFVFFFSFWAFSQFIVTFSSSFLFATTLNTVLSFFFPSKFYLFCAAMHSMIWMGTKFHKNWSPKLANHLRTF